MKNLTQHETEVLIVGGGLAGLRAAIEAQKAGCRVMMVTKGKAGRAGSSAITSAGYSVALGHADQDDTPQLHLEDTLNGGAGLNNLALARILCEEAVDRFWEMVEWGVSFERDDQGNFIQYPSGDHTRRRIAVCVGHAGTGMTLPLKAVATDVEFLDCVTALDLMIDAHGVSGLIGLDTRDRSLIAITAKCTILATGGIGQLYTVTSNPRDITGDGLALAFRAGAELTDLEFVQFYPWRLISHQKSRIPIQPSTFAEGGILRNAKGERFMETADPAKKEATTRDIAARAIFREIMEGRGEEGGVLLDISEMHTQAFANLNPRVARLFDKRGEDLCVARMILAPEAHFHMGGVRIDEWGRSSLPYLFAAGETAGGIHGGNRLDSNAIPAGQVFGRRAGRAASEDASRRPQPQTDIPRLRVWQARWEKLRQPGPGTENIKELKSAIRVLMWNHCGIIRNGSSLERGIYEASQLQTRAQNARPTELQDGIMLLETENLALVAELIMRSAAMRRESRGAHFRADYPESLDRKWRVNLKVGKSSAAEPLITLWEVESQVSNRLGVDRGYDQPPSKNGRTR